MTFDNDTIFHTCSCFRKQSLQLFQGHVLIRLAYDSWNCKICKIFRYFFYFKWILLFYIIYNYFVGGRRRLILNNKRTYDYFTSEKQFMNWLIIFVIFMSLQFKKKTDTDVLSFVRQCLWAAFLDGDGAVLCPNYLTVTVVVNSAVYI